MAEKKSLFKRLFGSKPKESTESAEPKKSEFGEEEKTFDGVVRQLRSDLEKDTIIGPHRPKKK